MLSYDIMDLDLFEIAKVRDSTGSYLPHNKVGFISIFLRWAIININNCNENIILSVLIPASKF